MNSSVTNSVTPNETIEGLIKENNLEELIYYVWTLPKWKKQVEVIDRIVEGVVDVLPFLKLVAEKMETVETDRKDKFFYLINLLIKKLDINRKNIEMVLVCTGQATLSYFWRVLVEKIDFKDRAMQEFLVGYVAYCPAYLLPIFEKVEFDTDLLRLMLKRDNLNYENRGFLCCMMRG